MIDLTACVGGNVLSFSKSFSKVYGIEMDATRHAMLQNNIHVMPRSTKAIAVLGK